MFARVFTQGESIVSCNLYMKYGYRVEKVKYFLSLLDLIMKIPFNKPYFTGKETDYIKQAVETGKISGDGLFNEKMPTIFSKHGTVSTSLS